MAEIDDWGPNRSAQASAGHKSTRPNMGLLDLLLHLWRAKWIMMLVAIPMSVLGMIVAINMPKDYKSFARLYVRAGDEIRMSSVVEDTGRDALPELEQIIQGELELLRSPLIIEQTLQKFDLQRLYPKLAEKAYAEARLQPNADREAIRFELNQKAIEIFGTNLEAYAAPKTPVITVSFKHENPYIAAEVLDVVLQRYLAFRSDLFGTRPVAKFSTQRERSERELLQAEEAIHAFLVEHEIGDFDSERGTARNLYEAASSQLFTVESRISAVEGQMASTRIQLSRTSQQLDIFVEDTSAQALRDLEIQRNQALVNYLPDSQTVMALTQQITELENYMEAQNGLSGTTRRGPNPTYQTLENNLNTLEAEAESLAGQRSVLRRQIARLDSQLARFARLESGWNALRRKRDILENNVRIIAEREQQEDTIASITAEEIDSVTIMEPAIIPLRGSSLRLPVAILALLFAGFTALIIGLISAYSARGFMTPGAVQRTLGLPVLGVVGRA